MVILEDKIEVIMEEVDFKVETEVYFRRNLSRDRNRDDSRSWRQLRSRERGMRARLDSNSRS